MTGSCIYILLDLSDVRPMRSHWCVPELELTVWSLRGLTGIKEAVHMLSYLSGYPGPYKRGNLHRCSRTGPYRKVYFYQTFYGAGSSPQYGGEPEKRGQGSAPFKRFR